MRTPKPGRYTCTSGPELSDLKHCLGNLNNAVGFTFGSLGPKHNEHFTPYLHILGLTYKGILENQSPFPQVWDILAATRYDDENRVVVFITNYSPESQKSKDVRIYLLDHKSWIIDPNEESYKNQSP